MNNSKPLMYAERGDFPDMLSTRIKIEKRVKIHSWKREIKTISL